LKFKNHETIIFDKFSQTTKGTKTETCLIWHTLSAIFIIPVHGTYTIDLANGQCLSKCHDTLSLKITSYQWMDRKLKRAVSEIILDTDLAWFLEETFFSSDELPKRIALSMRKRNNWQSTSQARKG
jgi:UDP-2,3-diacylglucosamine pyrophosphatase LpxH